MQNQNRNKKIACLLTPIALAVSHVFVVTAYAEEAKFAPVEVVATTPLAGIGLSLDKVSADVKVIKSDQMKEQNALTIADYMGANLPGVSIVETQGNPFQPDVRFHGFSASSLLGAPQGLSVYVDGVRVNEPFGDVVSWDLIQMNSVKQMQLVPGTNPVYGLNTLGGAISLETKRGRNSQGGEFEVSGGSWGRKNSQFEYGGVTKDGHDYFFAANYFDENGWRDASPTTVKQVFGQFGWQDSKTDLSMTISLADSNMTGNGLVPSEMMNSLGRAAVYTKPDETNNRMAAFNLKGSRVLSETQLLTGNLYYRDVTTKTLNGDLNDDVYEQGSLVNTQNINGQTISLSGVAAFQAACIAGGLSSGAIVDGKSSSTTYTAGGVDVFCSGVLNTTKTTKKGYGGSIQLNTTNSLNNRENHLITGIGYSGSKIKFTRDEQFGVVASDRSITPYSDIESSVSMNGSTNAYSIFASNSHSINSHLVLNTSARYDYTTISNVDNLVPTGINSLTGDHHFQRLNPSIGLNFKLSNNVVSYLAYNEGSRAPTSMELGCANPAAPCKLPNSMAGDPPLKQVVTKSFDLGLRGLNSTFGWSLSAYRASNYDDIQFIRNSTSSSATGYFTNVGETLRQGIDASLYGSANKFTWNTSLSLIRATYQDQFQAYVGNNKDKSMVAKGDRIPEIPAMQLKVRLAYQATVDWKVGATMVANSNVYLNGNENNGWYPATNYYGNGKASGYGLLNLDTQYRPYQGNLTYFAKISNVFNRAHNTGGLQGASMFDPRTNAYAGDDYRTSLFAPGAPRAAWVGVRYTFDKPVRNN